MFVKDTYRKLTDSLRLASLLAVVAGFASCAGKVDPVTPPENEPDEWAELGGDHLMRFASSLEERVTKSSALPSGATFGVFAYLQEGDITNHVAAKWSDGGWYPSFMYNTRVSFDGSEYSYSPVKYWPNNPENTISFWAYGPHSASTVFYEQGTTTNYTNATVGIPDIQFSVTSGKDDFVTSDFVSDKTYSNCTDESSEKGRVHFDFHHRLAQIEFKARTSADYSGLDQSFKIKKVEIINQYNSGVLSQNTSDNSASWTRVFGESSLGTTVFSGVLNLNYTEQACGDASYMMPQNMRHNATGESGNDVSARVTYVLRVNNVEITHTAVVSLYDSTVTSWEANKCYSYTLLLSATDGLSITVNVQPWEHWLGTGDYEENVTVTKQLTWTGGTYENQTTGRFTVNQVEKTYDVIVLKANTTLQGTFCFDTPYHGTWVAMLEPVKGSEFESIVFSNDSIQIDGMVGGDLTIGIKAGAGNYTQNQYALLRFMCRTESGQTLAVQEGSIGGPYVIALYAN